MNKTGFANSQNDSHCRYWKMKYGYNRKYIQHEVYEDRLVFQECFIWCTTFILLVNQIDVSKDPIQYIWDWSISHGLFSIV